MVPFEKVSDPEKVEGFLVNAGLDGYECDFFWDVKANLVMAPGDDAGLPPGEYVPGGSISLKG